MIGWKQKNLLQVNTLFEEDGIYTIVFHVENDEGLHEHEEHNIGVIK